MKVLGVDPGNKTGWAIVDTSAKRVVDSGVWVFKDTPAVPDVFYSFFDLVIYEDFVVGSGTAQKSREYRDALAVIGVLRAFFSEGGVDFRGYSPNVAKRFLADAELSMVVGGEFRAVSHVRDAVRLAIFGGVEGDVRFRRWVGECKAGLVSRRLDC